MITKQQLGQFFTINTQTILKGMEEFVCGKEIIDPFAGNCDLLNWAKKYKAKKVLGYDIDKKYIDNKVVFYNDSLKTPKKYNFVLTNPPYLYQNKLEDNTILLNTKHTDLYQLALEKIMNSKEGIVIVPINFLSSENAKYIRLLFLDKFDIIKINYFTTQVFEDTTYNVMAFYYRKKEIFNNKMTIPLYIYPENKKLSITLHHQYNWQIGGEFISAVNKFKNKLNIKRLEESDLSKGSCKIQVAYNHLENFREFNVNKNLFTHIKNNIVLLKAIDTGTEKGKICLEDIRKYNLDALVSIKSSRNQIYLLFPEEITIDTQKILIDLFNKELEEQREKYFSLFMTNFRDNNRKRISFNFAYNFINYLYFSKIKGQNYETKQYTLF